MIRSRVPGGVADLEAVYRRDFERFVRTAVAITGDEQIGRDAVQDAFVNALRSYATFRGDVPLAAWVWRVVVNSARQVRRARRFDVVDLDAADTAGATTNGIPAEDAVVRRWVSALPERQRLAVFLRYFADLDYRSIAMALEVEVGTVSATLATAHAALRRAMQEVER